MSFTVTNPAPTHADDLLALYAEARRARARLLGGLLRLALRRAARALRQRLRAALAAPAARRELLELDERQLRDVGLTRADVLRAADGARVLSVLFAAHGVPARFSDDRAERH
jgi:uncharacterized protein YjiS (DUF1127 family)